LNPAIVEHVAAPTNLATQDFWEDDYYRGIELPVRPNPSYPFERCLLRALEESAPVPAGARVFEIGCAPGRWLVWYAERFAANVTGLEYSARGVELTRNNLRAAAVTGDVVEGDFFSNELSFEPFDLVLSLGFIEHFDDIAQAFARHAKFVKRGGRLVVGMPNYRGVTGFFQRWADPAHLRLHNQDAMDPGRYQSFASDNDLRLDDTRFIGGIDPDLVRISRISARVALMPLRLWRLLPLSDTVNAPWLSSYLLLTFSRS
jgi:SAM-dependent methyltransferase